MKTWLDVGAMAISVAISLAGLAVAVWVVITGRPGKEGLDAMFLLVVALAIALLFGLIPAQAIRRGEWKLPARRRAKKEADHDGTANT